MGLCELNKAFFALGQTTEYVPPPSGWTVIVPPIPYRVGGGLPESTAQNQKPAPPRPWRALFFDNDFRYLDKPNNTYTDPFDFLKRMRLSPESPLVTDFGGEFRWQGKREDNRRLDGKENDYNLFRERLYFDTWYDDRFRVYVEGIWADSSHQTQQPLPTDINHGDLLNAFGEARLFSQDGRNLSVRYGRQELLFGNQRLVSPLDWVNTRRTFDDVAHLVYRSPSWDIDAFWGRPIVPRPRIFDYGTHKRYFYGVYAVCMAIPHQTLDFYFLGLSDGNRTFKGTDGAVGVQDTYTVGNRWQGNYHDWLWETETAYQFGDQANLSRSAGMATAGVGRRFADWWAKPELWFYYDYASGDHNPNNRNIGTFNQLFPLGHKYFGYMDIMGRQNAQDPNVVLTFYPSKRVNFLVWYHHLMLASARDALYNASGVATRRDPTGQSGLDVGDEVDLLMNIILSPHSDFQLDYSQFKPGRFIEHTGGGRDGSFFYGQFVYRF